MDFLPADTAAFKVAAKKVGLDVGPKKSCFVAQGEDHPGAVAALARQLADAGINITAMQATCAGEGRFGVLFWVKPEDVRKASRVLGAQ
jgi:predicted amino acid-binding ACT domain protein